MDTRPEDLSDFERRLGSLLPGEQGLRPDMMLYAAGMAAARARASRFVWPTMAFLLAVVAVGLGRQLVVERGEHRALAAELRFSKERMVPVEPLGPDIAPATTPSTETVLSSHVQLSHGLEELRSASAGVTSPERGSEEQAPLRAWPLRSSPRS